jgi:Protein of unknown function (DUF3349)
LGQCRQKLTSAYLARSLKPEEVTEVVSALGADRSLGHKTATEDVKAAVEAVTASPALRSDAQRVEQHLRESGWELEPAAER